MKDNTSTSFLTVLFEYEQKVEPMANCLANSILPVHGKVNAELFAILFGLYFNKDSTYERLKAIVNDDNIGKIQLETSLNECLSNVQNDFQALAFYRTIERTRKSWFSYLEGIRRVFIIAHEVEEELEVIVQTKRFGLVNYPRALESIPYISSFAGKFFEIFNVLDTYYELLENKRATAKDSIDYKQGVQNQEHANPLNTNKQEVQTVTVPALACMCVYLAKAKYFPTAIGKQIKYEIAPKYKIQGEVVSGNSLYNDYYYYRKEQNRLKPSNILNIKLAIKLLDRYEIEAAKTYASCDLLSLRKQE